MNITVKAILLMEIDIIAYVIIGSVVGHPIVFIVFMTLFMLIMMDWTRKAGDELVKEMRRL
jgi:UPF0716 family protein affecting phage T7 exclusion